MAPAAVASFLAALSKHGGADLPSTLVSYLRSRPKLATNLGSGDEEPSCGAEWIDVGMCIYGADPTGALACKSCTEEAFGGLDDDSDYCEQLADKADEEWCSATEACLVGCGNTIEGTAEACGEDWGELLGCLSVTPEEFMAYFEQDGCPDHDICGTDGFAIAMN